MLIRRFSFVVPLVLASACAAPSVALVPRLSSLDVDGQVGVNTSGSVTSTNSSDSLGLQEDSGVFGARVDLRWGSPHLTLATSDSTHDGQGQISASLTQGGTTIPANENVNTTFDLGLTEAVLTFDLVPTDKVELGIGFGVTAVSLDATVTSTGPNVPGTQVQLDETLPIPVLAGRLAIAVSRVELSLLLAGLSVDIDNDKASFFDADLQARVRLIGGGGRFIGSLALGWREVSADVEYEDGQDQVKADLTFSGPYLGLVLAF